MHLFGNVAPVAEVEALGVPVLEDAAQATGSTAARRARPARWATIATFSFYPSKNLGGLGDGGAIATDDADAGRARAHAALPRLAGQGDLHGGRLQQPPRRAAGRRPARPAARTCTRGASGRRAAGRAYAAAGLGDHARLPVPAEGADPAWNLYVVRHPRPEELASALRAADIGARTYYPVPAHRQPALADAGATRSCPGPRRPRGPISRCRWDRR